MSKGLMSLKRLFKICNLLIMTFSYAKEAGKNTTKITKLWNWPEFSYHGTTHCPASFVDELLLEFIDESGWGSDNEK